MMYLGYTAVGDKVELGVPVSVVINRDEDAPADDFTGIFPINSAMPPIAVIHVFRGDELAFYGIVDEQTVQITSDGSTCKIIARSRAALLLDNEALPQTYIHPSLKTIFERHALPYGFKEFRGTPGAFKGEMTVTKGMSEWQVIENFCTYFLGTAPKITVDGILDASGEKPGINLYFSNMGGGIPYLSLSISDKYHALISEIYAQSSNAGEYIAKNVDLKAAELGIMRKRYLSAAKSSNAYFNSKQMTKNAHRKFQEIVLICPGKVKAQLGEQATVKDKLFGNCDGLSVAKITYTIGSGGEFCKITLRNDD